MAVRILQEHQNLIVHVTLCLQLIDSLSLIMSLEIIEDRHNPGSKIVSSQIQVKGWYEIIGEKMNNDAIPERLVHRSHRIGLAGRSMLIQRKIISEEKV